MTKKHFWALADMVRMELTVGRGFTQEQREIIAGSLAALCGRFNDQFDHRKFVDACGVSREVA